MAISFEKVASKFQFHNTETYKRIHIRRFCVACMEGKYKKRIEDGSNRIIRLLLDNWPIDVILAAGCATFCKTTLLSYCRDLIDSMMNTYYTDNNLLSDPFTIDLSNAIGEKIAIQILEKIRREYV